MSRPIACTLCQRRLPPTAFSKRQLSPAVGWDAKRCRTCVASAEAGERSQAAEHSARDSIASAWCSACCNDLPSSRFTRTQLLQKTDDVRRCLACVETAANVVRPHLALPSAVPADCAEEELLALPRPHIEIARQKAMKRLRRTLISLCSAEGAEPPLMAFDRWVGRAHLPVDAATSAVAASLEPLLPTRDFADEGLVKDLCRSRALNREKATAIALEMARVSSRAAVGLVDAAPSSAAAAAASHAVDGAGTERAGVTVTQHGALLRLNLQGVAKPYVDISNEHFEKLAALYSRHRSQPLARGARADGELHECLFAMLMRYASLGAHGSQCAVPPTCFGVLSRRLSVSFECFASPLNARFERFCSAFPDVDRPFGSVGSFFRFTPDEGSFEANPPYEPAVLLAAIHRAEALLATADRDGRALSFAFVVPTWDVLPFHHQLLRSRWLRGAPLQLPAEGHAFVDGAAHVKEHLDDRLRVSSFGTTIGVLQSTEGMARWPVDAELHRELAETFRAALPSADNAAARMQRGGGDAVSLLLRQRAKCDTEGSDGASGSEAAPAPGGCAASDPLNVEPPSERGTKRKRVRKP